MSFTFVKIKKEAAFQKDVLEEMFEEASEEVQEAVAALPENNDNCGELLDGLYKLIEALEKSPKGKSLAYLEKDQMYCLVGYLLNTQRDDAACLNRFIKWFFERAEPSIYKVRICSLLFKSVDNTNFKKLLLIRSIQVLAQEKKLVLLASFLQDLDQLLVGLKLSNSELSEVYLHVIRSLQEYPVYKKLVVDFVVKYLEIADTNDTANIDGFLSYLVNNSTVDERLIAVGQSPALRSYNSVMFRLFKLYLAGDIAGFHQLVKEEQAAIAKLGTIRSDSGINTTDYLYKLKVQYIAKLAAQNKIISYAEFAKQLQVPLSDVERLIIYAIENDVVEASLDEFQQTITVKEVKSQYFSQSEWPSILRGLDALISRLEDSLKNGVQV